MNTGNDKSSTEIPLAFTVNKFCAAMNVSRTTVYELIKRGELHSVTVAGRRLIPASEAHRLLGNAEVRS